MSIKQLKLSLTNIINNFNHFKNHFLILRNGFLLTIIKYYRSLGLFTGLTVGVLTGPVVG